jgi:Rod binding domain-containing protein
MKIMRQTEGSSGATNPHDVARIQTAAKEFEAAMISAWWEAMQTTFTQNEPEKLTGDSGVLQDLSRQTMASAIASAGGIGVAKDIVRKLVTGGEQASKVPAASVDLKGLREDFYYEN